MKTKLIITSIALSLLALTGCQDEEPAQSSHINKVRVYATSNLAGSRVAFTEGDQVTYATWDQEDAIGLSTDEQGNLKYTASAASANGQTEFLPTGSEVADAEGKTIYAYYPYIGSEEDGGITVQLPGSHNYEDIQECTPFLYAQGEVVNNEVALQFKHLYAYLKLTISKGVCEPSESTQLHAVKLVNKSDEPLTTENGKVITGQPLSVTDGHFNLQTGEIEQANYTDYVSIGISDTFDLAQSDWTAYIPVLPQKDGNSLTVYIDLEEDYTKEILMKTVPTGGLLAGHVYTLTIGQTEEQPDTVPDYYTSSDYSRDGEVITLQTATTGKGIDLVFMGDAYVDRDMETNGKYEQDMKTGMEHFFSIEPYKTFRDRFNVYAVKVVSPNEIIDGEFDKGEHRISFQNDTCFKYAGKITGMDSDRLDKVTIVNIINNPSEVFWSGYTNMYPSGASVAHIEIGGPTAIIIHEAGGHGFAKLLDEYIYSGFEEATIDENGKSDIDTYHAMGWWANVDATNDPSQVEWAHFLSDSRYAAEVGIYEGAYLWGYGAYRPSDDSVMRHDYSWFNAPSREAIYKAIMKASEGDSWTYSYEDFVAYDAINRDNYVPRSAGSRSAGQKAIIKHRPPVIMGSRPGSTGR